MSVRVDSTMSGTQKIAQIREAVQSMDSLIRDKVQLSTQSITKIENENRMLTEAIHQRDHKIRELTEKLQQKDNEIQDMEMQMARKRSLPPPPPPKPIEPEFVDEDDRLSQLRMLQRRLEVAQEEVGSKEIILRMLRDSIIKTGTDFDAIDLQIQDIDNRLMSYGQFNDPEAVVRLEKIKRLEEKLEKTEVYMEQFISAVDQSRGPLRQTSYRPSSNSQSNTPQGTLRSQASSQSSWHNGLPHHHHQPY
eukprot:TRINITY_DN1643_c0_g1_i1.p1 TRINITY_DN1643_c0_g1~~TRINITY_DN1643_c0_g1_i1.p1  ORF type:complete len:249 (-),score=71.09 TRINITY_DN1643_c0_g1_i1:558-1304(-)